MAQRGRRSPQRTNPVDIVPNQERDDRRVVVSKTTTQQWSGPLPSPAALEAFEQAVPGAGKLILEEFNAEASHRRALERQQGNLIVRETHVGQVLAIVFALACLAVAAYAASVHAEWIGAIVGGGVIVSGMVALLGRRQSKPEIDGKD